MTKLETPKNSVQDLYLEHFLTIKNQLETLKNLDFDKKAAQIAIKYDLDKVLVRAIGRSAITSCLCPTKNTLFIKKYIQLNNKESSEQERIENLSEIFNISAQLVNKIVQEETTSLTEIEDYQNSIEEEVEKKKLTKEDKDFISDYVAEAQTKTEKQARRKECAQDFDVSIGVISAITAWTTIRKIREDKPLEEQEEEKKITPPLHLKTPETKETTQEHFNSVQAYIRDKVAREYAKGGQELADKVKEGLTKETSKTRKQIDSIAAWLKIKPEVHVPEDVRENFLKKLKEERINKNSIKTVEASLSAVLTSADLKITENTLDHENITERQVEIIENNGAHFEYNNKIKNKWREKMKSFLSKRIPERDRKHKKVLCFPGQEWLEVKDIYLDLGFNPKNIWGVERVKSVKDVFEKNAETLGCNTYFGNMIDFLDNTNEIFDVVSLDFVGPFCYTSEKIIKKLKLSDHPFILTNFMAKRENSGKSRLHATNLSTQIMNKLHADIQSGAMSVKKIKQKHSINNYYNEINQEIETYQEKISDKMNLQNDIRDVSLRLMVYYLISKNKLMLPSANEHSQWQETLDEEKYMKNLIQTITEFVFSKHEKTRNNTNYGTELLYQYYDSCTHQRFNLHDSESLKYFSKGANGSSSPFFSDFIELSSETFDERKKFFNFIQKYKEINKSEAHHTLEIIQVKSQKYKIRKEKILSPTAFKNKSTVLGIMQKGKIITSLPLRSILEISLKSQYNNSDNSDNSHFLELANRNPERNLIK